ncbi:hypothetical protein HYH02_009549 [Chlamydomonas schloesseri]|uniref:4-hydroxybenzoate polyprenyltransferase, mitochondrial n=1 Tax=Chlamydomonas schloesseri TaxID=2026947 RepID=A0A835TDJ3_9CHLO|nr:hypothetical protein HYH02_009549 [Chlamydomonas schloesseri]|eukprot:KAG2443138.1 hypothetical protein HYH02_009549 [Chlamydomonas schloesseri]
MSAQEGAPSRLPQPRWAAASPQRAWRLQAAQRAHPSPWAQPGGAAAFSTSSFPGFPASSSSSSNSPSPSPSPSSSATSPQPAQPPHAQPPPPQPPHARMTDAEREAAIEAAPPTAAGASLLMAALPPRLVPYAQLMRLDKPIGTWLLALPCMWSIGLATPAGQLPSLYMMALFGAGAVLLRGAGCTINDLWDRRLDAAVERTRSRPLAAGTLKPVDAIALLAVQLSLGLVILLQLNDYSKLLGASSLVLVGTYPLMKRVTFWPQAFLGLTMNWGALLGYSAVAGALDPAVCLPLYGAGVAWTLVYDTIYAHQDKKDDAVVGVKSTALLFGAASKSYFTAFTAATAAGLVAAGLAAGAGPSYYAGAAGMLGHMVWQIQAVDLDDGPDCAAKFASNKWAGGMLAAGILADKVASAGWRDWYEAM